MHRDSKRGKTDQRDVFDRHSPATAHTTARRRHVLYRKAPGPRRGRETKRDVAPETGGGIEQHGRMEKRRRDGQRECRDARERPKQAVAQAQQGAPAGKAKKTVAVLAVSADSSVTGSMWMELNSKGKGNARSTFLLFAVVVAGRQRFCGREGVKRKGGGAAASTILGCGSRRCRRLGLARRPVAESAASPGRRTCGRAWVGLGR